MRTKHQDPTIYEKISYIVNYARQKWRGKYWYQQLQRISGISYRTWYHWIEKDCSPQSEVYIIAISALYERFKEENKR